MPITPSNFGELLWPGIHTHYGLGYAQYPEEYPAMFEVRTSTLAYEDSLLLTGFGQIPQKGIGSSVQYNEPKQGWKHQSVHITFGLGFIVASELYEDDQYGKINQYPRELARSVRSTIETTAANIYNRAHNDSYLGADGLEMCSTVHLKKGGGTWSNEPTIPVDLDETSLEQALIDIAAFVNDEGLKINAQPVRLLVNTNNHWNAQKLLGSSQEPGTANNAINPAEGIMPYKVCHYFDDPNAWFIRTNVMNGPTFFWRRRPGFTMDNDFDSENAKYKTIYRMSVTWFDPRGVYGSPGG